MKTVTSDPTVARMPAKNPSAQNSIARLPNINFLLAPRVRRIACCFIRSSIDAWILASRTRPPEPTISTSTSSIARETWLMIRCTCSIRASISMTVIVGWALSRSFKKSFCSVSR